MQAALDGINGQVPGFDSEFKFKQQLTEIRSKRDNGQKVGETATYQVRKTEKKAGGMHRSSP